MLVFCVVGLVHCVGDFAEDTASAIKTQLPAFAALCVAGATVWLIIAAYLKGALFYGNGLNHFIYWIDGTIFVLTLVLAYNMLQVLRSQGKWKDYIFGERIFMILSCVAKTGLAWLVFAGFLR